MEKETQKTIILKICKKHCPARTEQVQIQGLHKGIADSSRQLRYLQVEGKIVGEYRGKNRTKTWTIERSVRYPKDKKQEPQEAEKHFEKLLTIDTIRKDRGKIDEILT